MPPDMEVSMRHTKLKASEAALLAGEISKPSWESRNEGIHERVSFEDTIWGFDLAGGVFYKTPLRVTMVKPDSRAEKAGIRPGDKLLRINDIDTSTLTIQQAHEIIVNSGIYLKISVTSPDDEEDAYYCYEDPIVEGYDSDEERRLEEERAAKRRVHAKVSSYWSLQWPWVSKRRLIYRESNCFMVNSKYEDARREKYPTQPTLRYTDDNLLYQKDGDKLNSDGTIKDISSLKELKENNNDAGQQKITNGDADSDIIPSDDEQLSHVSENEQRISHDSSISPIMEDENTEELSISHDLENSIVEENNDDENTNIETKINEENINKLDTLSCTTENLGGSQTSKNMDESRLIEEKSEDDVINEVLAKGNDSMAHSDEDNILDSILSDDGQNLESSEANNER